MQATVACPRCGLDSERVWSVPPVLYNCDGFHATDYGKGVGTGSKVEQMNKAWGRAWGEEPPPPATDVPRNKRDRY